MLCLKDILILSCKYNSLFAIKCHNILSLDLLTTHCVHLLGQKLWIDASLNICLEYALPSIVYHSGDQFGITKPLKNRCEANTNQALQCRGQLVIWSRHFSDRNVRFNILDPHLLNKYLKKSCRLLSVMLYQQDAILNFCVSIAISV